MIFLARNLQFRDFPASFSRSPRTDPKQMADPVTPEATESFGKGYNVQVGLQGLAVLAGNDELGLPMTKGYLEPALVS